VKLRSRLLTARQRAYALSLFTTIAAESCERLRVTAEAFHDAARFADQFRPGLRAGDALHLAVAAKHGLTMVTLDKGLARAATALGISSTLL
jgi:predicted nucleic acid-binding protein